MDTRLLVPMARLFLSVVLIAHVTPAAQAYAEAALKEFPQSMLPEQQDEPAKKVIVNTRPASCNFRLGYDRLLL